MTRLDSLAAIAPTDVTHALALVFGDSLVVRDSTIGDVEPSWDIDVRSYETHERVAHYVELFTGSARERFLARLSRGTRYEPMIRAKLRAGGLPEDMTYLALIESGYDPHAYSRAAAVGMWQFMSSTARDVGLRVDWWVDERRDPARATDGAIRFLRDLQQQFGGSLYLAAAAYNGGPGRVARGLTRFADDMEGSEGEDRFFALAEQDYLRSETKNYVPQLIAAALVAKVPSRYNLQLDSLPLYAYDSVAAAPGTSLAAVSSAGGITVAELRDLNPAILRGVTPPTGAYWVKVPEGTGTRTARGLDSMPESARLGYETRRVDGGKTTLASIAADAGISTRQLAWFNPSIRVSKGRVASGQTVRVPTAGTLAFALEIPDPSIEKYGTTETATLTRSGYHVVRRGESMAAVAKRYGLTVARLKSINGIKGSRLVSGQTLRVKAAPAKASTSASRTRVSSKASTKSSRAGRTATKSTAKGGSAKRVAKASASKGARNAKSSTSSKSAKSPAKSKKAATKSTASASRKRAAK